MINMDNLFGNAKKALKSLGKEDLNASAGNLKELCASAFSELTNNVDLLNSLDISKPMKANDNEIGSVVRKLKTTAMSKLLKTGEKTMSQGVLEQLSGSLFKNGSSLFELLPDLIGSFDKLKAMFKEKSETAKPKTVINNILDKAGPVLNLLKIMK